MKNMICMFLTIVFTQSYAVMDIDGTLTDSLTGEPIAQAVIGIKYVIRKCTTDTDGYFRFSSLPVRNLKERTYTTQPVFIKHDRLHWNCPAPDHITVSAYNIAGRRVAVLFDGEIKKGAFSTKLPSPGAGLYIYELKTSGSTMTIPSYGFSSKRYFSNTGNLSAKKFETTSKSFDECLGREDTLILFAAPDGYFPQQYPIYCTVSKNLQLSFNRDLTRKMVSIDSKGKSFIRGTDNPDGPFANENPAHQVSFTYDYMISATPVTQKEYMRITGVNPSRWTGDMKPVHKVTWYDAVLFCNAMSSAAGLDAVYSWRNIQHSWHRDFKYCSRMSDVRIYYGNNGYRLPTEAEWEYAARADTNSAYSWGDDGSFEKADKYAWYNRNSGNEVQPIAQKLPNKFGLYDMNGNVLEWCNDNYARYDTASSVTDPTGPLSSEYRVMKGAHYDQDSSHLRSAYRAAGYKEMRMEPYGFRLVRRK